MVGLFVVFQFFAAGFQQGKGFPGEVFFCLFQNFQGSGKIPGQETGLSPEQRPISIAVIAGFQISGSGKGILCGQCLLRLQ